MFRKGVALAAFAVTVLAIARVFPDRRAEPTRVPVNHGRRASLPPDAVTISLASPPICDAAIEWTAQPAGELVLTAGHHPNTGGRVQAIRLTSHDAAYAVLVERNRTLLTVSLTGGVTASVQLDAIDGFHGVGTPTLVSNPPSDSVLLWDSASESIAVLSSSLTLVRTVALEAYPTARRTEIEARYDNGDFLVRRLVLRRQDSGPGVASSLFAYGRQNPRSNTLKPILSIEGPPFGEVQGILTALPMSSDPVAAVFDQYTYILDARHAVLFRSRDGGMPRAFRFSDSKRPPVTEELKEAVLSQEFFAELGEVRPDVSEAISALGFPDQAPAFDELLVDTTNRVWIRRFGFGDNAVSWIVVDFVSETPRPCVLGVPRRFDLVDADSSRLVGVWHAADGAMSMRVYDLVGKT